MSESQKHIDQLVKDRALRQSELEELGETIAESAKFTVVVFVDLADSTGMKEEKKPEDWLGSVFEFIRHCDQLARSASGTVVKRIGDEVMLTFTQVSDSEHFISSLNGDPVLGKQAFKVAADAGPAYHFRFLEHLEDDPYGSVVDRCARISKLAAAGSVVCSADYLASLTTEHSYVEAGEFSLKGISKPCKLYVRSIRNTEPTAYLQRLIDAANKNISTLSGYRSVGRELTTQNLRDYGTGSARPFIARELLNIPMLPHSTTSMQLMLKEAGYIDAVEHSLVGYFVEWEGTFDNFERDGDDLRISLQANFDSLRVKILLPGNYREVVKEFRKGQKMLVRGVIQHVFMSHVILNYAEIRFMEN